MTRLAVAVVAALAAVTASSLAQADSIFDVEHARAIAKAGGPVTDLDAELLERHGVWSGTPRDWRSRRAHSWTWYAEPNRRAYRRLDRARRRAGYAE